MLRRLWHALVPWLCFVAFWAALGAGVLANLKARGF